MKKLLALILAVCLVLCLCACELKLPFIGGGKDEPPAPTDAPAPTAAAGQEDEEKDPALGKYLLYACQIDGVYVDATELFDGEYSVELRNNGRVTLLADGEKTKGKYTLDGEDIAIAEDDDTVYGTLRDGVLRLEMEDSDFDGAYMIFAREDADTSGMERISFEEFMGGSTPGGSIYTNGYVCSTDDYLLCFMGVEPFEDSDGRSSIRLYYDFMNRTDETVYAGYRLGIEAYQDNRALDEAFSEVQPAVEQNVYRGVRPGATVRCACTYNYNPSGGTIRFIVEDWDEGTVLDINLDPRDMPQMPRGPWSPAPVEDPRWTDAYDWEGYLGDVYVYVDSAERAEDDEGNACVRVYYWLTNYGDEEVYGCDLSYALFQDGLELPAAWAYDCDTDDAMYEPIAPGETLIVSTLRQLYSDRPFEVEVRDYWSGDEPIGGVFGD